MTHNPFGSAQGVLAPDAVPTLTADGDVKITGVETYALAVPLARPIADATAAMAHWVVPVVEVHTADGRVGTGISGVHCAPELLTDTIDRYYAAELIGSSADDILGTWKRLYWLPTHWLGRAGVVHMALSMIDIALWDLAAQRAGLPLWKMLGGSADPIEAYNTDGGWLNFSQQKLIGDLHSLVDQGWRRIKIKVGMSDWREDVQRVKAVRTALGDDIVLMCDANQRWDFSTASRILPALEEFGMDWVEEPLHADDLQGHRRLQRSARLDIAAGESIYSFQQFSSFIDADAMRVVQVDATRVGGITEWLQVASLAASRGLRVVPHAGDMMQLHQNLVGTVISEPTPLAEFIPWTRAAFRDRIVITEGKLIRPQQPGASTAIEPAARERWQLRDVGRMSAA